MACDAAPRHGVDSLPQTLGRQFHYVDEVDLGNSFHHSVRHEMIPDMSALLSPVEEEHRGFAWEAPLAVHVHIKFHDSAIRSAYDRTYFSSQSFTPTDRICRGLLRRIQHCSEELITRRDSNALNPTQCLHKGPKSLRFELTFSIHRKGHFGTWAERAFESYQKHTLTSISAMDVLRSTHDIVGMFLRRHDAEFQWTDDPAHNCFPDKPETFTPSLTGPPDLRCIPRGLFIDSSQTWEFVPGYFLELTLKSSDPAQCRSEITKTLRFDSRQTSPLNVGFGEELLWQAYMTVQDVFDQRKSTFDLEHVNCDGYDGVPDCDCQHIDENAFDVELRVVNNLGPVYEHLHRSIHNRLRLSIHLDGQDCDDFVSKISARLQQFRDRTDKKVEKLHDFDFRIAELIGHGWHLKNCARFIIDGRQSHSRRGIEALLDRIRTGVKDVLRAHDVAIQMIAYKRGHLVFDKALIARDHQQTPVPDNSISGRDQQHMLLARLKIRIQRDIDMICRDTCNLDDVPDIPRTPEQPLRHARSYYSPSRPYTPRTPASYIFYQVAPGTPAKFATHPATPPEVPIRKSSRAFPLVPARYKEKSESESDMAVKVQDPAVGLGFDDRNQARSGTAKVGPAIELRLPAVTHDTRPESASGRGDVPGLKPAAEVFPALKRSDYDTDSSSTHSSMPALTESDASTPDQRMLITPNFRRSSSPFGRNPALMSGSETHLPSTLWMVDNSAPSSTTFPEVERFVGPKPVVAQTDKLPSGHPVTPGRADAAPVDTPRALMTPSGDEKTPLAHRHLQGPTEPELLEDPATSRKPSPHDITHQTLNIPEIIIGEHDSEPDCPRPVTAEPAEPENVDNAPQDIPTEGWLLHVEDQDVLSYETHKSYEDSEVGVAAAEYGSSGEALSSSTVTSQGSMDQVAELEDDELANGNSSVSRQPHQNPPAQTTGTVEEPESLMPAEQLGSNASTSSGSVSSCAATEPELPQTASDSLEPDEESPINVETIQHSGPVGDGTVTETQEQLMGMSGGPETDDYISLSDSGIDISTGSGASESFSEEFEQKHILSPIVEDTFDFDSDTVDSILDPSAVLAGPEWAPAPGPSDNTCARDADASDSTATRESLSAGGPENPSQEFEFESPKSAAVPVPTADPEPVGLSETELSAPTTRSSRSVSNPHLYSAQVGLGNAQLLPSLPILASRTTSNTTGNTRAGRSSSSSWEDYLSSGRQSSDSVDTIKLSPTASCQSEEDDEEGPHSLKRLGTPTAGLLGLHEPRWAELGIRTALTGTHAFDLPSAARVTKCPKPECEDIEKSNQAADGYVEELCVDGPERSLSPRKVVLLKHEKSASSIKSATKTHRLDKKQSRELKKQERSMKAQAETIPASGQTTLPEDDGIASRLPKAMMLVAGLAFASSVVSRHHS